MCFYDSGLNPGLRRIVMLLSCAPPMQSIFRRLPKLCSPLMCALPPPKFQAPSTPSLPRRGKREFATLQLRNSDEGPGLGKGTAHLDIKHLVKNCRWPEGILELTGGEVASFFSHFQGETPEKNSYQDADILPPEVEI